MMASRRSSHAQNQAKDEGLGPEQRPCEGFASLLTPAFRTGQCPRAAPVRAWLRQGGGQTSLIHFHVPARDQRFRRSGRRSREHAKSTGSSPAHALGLLSSRAALGMSQTMFSEVECCTKSATLEAPGRCSAAPRMPKRRRHRNNATAARYSLERSPLGRNPSQRDITAPVRETERGLKASAARRFRERYRFAGRSTPTAGSVTWSSRTYGTGLIPPLPSPR